MRGMCRWNGSEGKGEEGSRRVVRGRHRLALWRNLSYGSWESARQSYGILVRGGRVTTFSRAVPGGRREGRDKGTDMAEVNSRCPLLGNARRRKIKKIT